MVFAALLLAGLLMVLKLPTPASVAPVAEIIFQLAADEEIPEPEPEPEQSIELLPTPDVTVAELPIEEPPQILPSAEIDAPIDWYEAVDQAVQETVSTANHVDSMHPVFDEKRRRAAIKFRASRAPYKKKIWENVELDQLGRTILTFGTCSRVVDDPSAINYYMQHEFTQYMVSCSYQRRLPKELPWVDDVRGRYAYLEAPAEPRYE